MSETLCPDTEQPCRDMVKGRCKDCLFRRQAYNELGTVDRFCDLFDVFVPEEGFCHGFEPSTEV